jgi:uncharacterized protein
MKIRNNIIKIVLVSLLALGFSACDDNESSSKINSEKKVRLPKPEWDSRLSNIEPDTGKWFQLADDDEIAAYNIGVIYSDKIKDYNKAIGWYLYSDSIKTNSNNLFNLALTYEYIKDYDKAINYYKRSYDLNNFDAPTNLGILYIELKNYAEAEHWLKKGIERESITSIKSLGLLYHNNLNDDVKSSAYYIALIDKKYSKMEVLNLLKNKWKLSNETIKKGYELQLTMPGLPRRYTGDLELK